MNNPSSVVSRIHVTVSGHVQGVGFRFFTMQSAWTNEITGWVRNRINGDVEIIAEGNKDALATFLADVRRGPASSSVRDVKVEYLPYQGEFTDFQPRQTA